ncbi:MAG: hypothetical protein JJT78_08090 [Leptospira sp.]|nr:hypothetical protein [Leptospira sp.]
MLRNLSFFLSISIFSLIAVISPTKAQPRLSYALWVEDSLGIEFKFPRAWMKQVQRSPSNLIAQFTKDDSIILRVDSQKRTGDWDADRFAEETLDQFIMKYPDLKVIQEVRLDEGYQGFDEAHFLVAHYKENGELITNRFLFLRKDTNYFITQAKVIRKEYHKYRSEVDLFMKSLIWNQIPRDRWRNDSLNYLTPSDHETTINYIRDSLRPSRVKNQRFNSALEYNPTIIKDQNSNTESRRPIRDIEPGQNPPPGGVTPISDTNPDPI